MHNITSFSVFAKVGLLIGVMLALFLLSSGLYDSAHARTAPETIDYEEGRTDAVAAFTAVDPEGHGIQWTLMHGDRFKDDFSIDGGALTFKSTPDYETPTDSDTEDNDLQRDGASRRRITKPYQRVLDRQRD